MILAEPGRTQWDLKWKMLGVPVRVHPLFWLAALLLSFDKNIPFPFVLLAMACIFASILVHEFGHALCRRFYGDLENHVVIYHFGGLSVGSRNPRGLWPKIAILLWGPGAGFILGAIAYGAGAALYRPDFPWRGWYPDDYAAALLRNLVWINFAWGLMNLLPVFPLDGGQIMRESILARSPAKGDPHAFKLSCYFALAIAVLAVVKMIFWQGPSDLMLVLLFAILAWGSYNIRTQLGTYGSLADREPVREAWEQDPDWWKK